MYLFFVDETGRGSLDDPQQPFFILIGALVRDIDWFSVHEEFVNEANRLFPNSPSNFEIHGYDLENGKGCFKGIPFKDRRSGRDKLLSHIAKQKRIHLCECVIAKASIHSLSDARARTTLERPAALYFLSLNALWMYIRGEHLTNQQNESDRLCMFVHDEVGDKDLLTAVRTVFRMTPNSSVPIGVQSILGLQSKEMFKELVETSLFVPSHWSCLIQIADLCAYHANVWYRKAGKHPPYEQIKDSMELRIMLSVVNGKLEIKTEKSGIFAE